MTNALIASFDTPAYFNGQVYYVGANQIIKAFSITNGFMNPTPASQGLNELGFPGCTPSISANGTNDAIAWAIQSENYSTNGPAVLHAFNAANLTDELYNSGQPGQRDLPGGAVKFAVPTIANGKVYVGTETTLAVFGNGSFLAVPTISPNGGTNTTSVSVSLADATPGTSLYYTLDNTNPTTNSTPYTGSFTVTNYVVVSVQAFKTGFIPSAVTSAQFFIKPFVAPAANFTGTPTAGATPLTVTFTDSSTGSITNRSWMFGDGGTTNTLHAIVAYTYNSVGTNTVKLIVIGPAGVSTNTRTNYIVVTNTLPQQVVSPATNSYGVVATSQSSTQNFLVVNTGGALLTGTANILSGPFSVVSGSSYNVSGGSTATVSVAFNPVTTGNFTNLIVFASNGGNSTNTVIGSGAIVPAASFTGSPTSGLIPLVVTFTDSSTGTITNRSWAFGDGGTTNTTSTTVAYTYNSAGTDTVTLVVTGPVGVSTNIRVNYIIATNIPPKQVASPGSLSFGLLPVGQSSTQVFSVANAGLQTLVGTATVSGATFSLTGGSPYTVGGGQTGLVSVSFSPVSAGAFTGSVMFASNGGLSTNPVTGAAAVPPSASFTGTPVIGLVPLAVTFTDSSSGTVTNRSWNFGDGGTTNTLNTTVAYTYNSKGTDTVTLVITGPLGVSTNTRVNYILVTNIPPQQVITPLTNNYGVVAVGQSSTQSFSVVNAGVDSLTGTATVVSGPYIIISGSAYNVSGGHTGTVSVAFNPVAVGSFTNSVVFASNGGNSTNTLIGSGAISPIAGFTGTPTNGLVPLAVTFTDSSTGTITNRSWSFGDGGMTNTLNTTVNYTYNSIGTNTVRLVVTGPLGVSTNSRVNYILVTNIPPQQVVSPVTNNYALVAVGQSSTQNFAVVNAGVDLLSGTAMVVSGPYSIVSGSPYSVSGGHTGTVSVAFNPVAVGNFTNAVVFASNGGNSTNTLIGSGAVAPSAGFTGTPTNGLVPLVVTFTDSSTGTITNRSWSFGDGGTTNTLNTTVAHTYNSAGTNTVALVITGPLGVSTNARVNYIMVTNIPPQQVTSPVTNNYGVVAVGQSSTQNFSVVNAGVDSLTGTATVISGPYAIISGSPYNVAGGKTGTVGVAFNPVTVGSFTNSVVFAGNGGNSTNTLIGSGAISPSAAFTGTPTNGLVPLAVTFTDTSTGTITNRSWSFGDGGTTNTLNTTVVHTYNLVGTNTVVLVVTGPLGASTNSRVNYIVVTNIPPQQVVSPANLDFGLLPVGQSSTQAFSVANNGLQTLTGTATVSGATFTLISGSPFTVGGGQTGLVNVSFSPVAAGAFTGSVVFTSNGGSSTDVVTGAAAVPPSAGFTGTPTNGLAPLAVTFTDTSTGTITNRSWSFGDGGATNTLNTTVAYTYNLPGTNTVRLVVTGPLGLSTNTTADYIIVTNIPPLQIVSPVTNNFGFLAVGQSSTQSFSVANAGVDSLTGTATVAGGPYSITSGGAYNITGNHTGTVSVGFAPLSVGNFTNSIIFASNGGFSTNLLIGGAAIPPVASFNATPTNGAAPLLVTFTDGSTGTITNRFWNFGDASSTNTSGGSVQHTYGEGTYSVILIASGPVGSSTNTQVDVVVALNPFVAWQLRYFGCTNLAICPQAAGDADPDGDGMSNTNEFLTGTDPTNSASSFHITSIVETGNDLFINWMTGIGRTNALQWTPGAADGTYVTDSFADLFTVTNATGTVTNYLDLGAATNVPARYYRVRLVP